MKRPKKVLADEECDSRGNFQSLHDNDNDIGHAIKVMNDDNGHQLKMVFRHDKR
jgi:hypothetical protein